ncbi:MAG: hypothetical protein IPI49_12645 [Myxococcales bacterium]|nr:hypothetical protein [Myxococcales bacterium]
MLGDELTVLGPFPDNAPPYLAYDLVGAPPVARLEVRARSAAGALAVATDGAAALEHELLTLACEPRFVDHPDALRRHLATLARAGQRIRWSERRVEHTPARLQDDAAIGLVRWGQP